jgi:stage II sporulation protein D
MSQYGAYGYALHHRNYRFILAHYYQGTTLGRTDPNTIVRVLLANGAAAFSGANRAGTKRLKARLTYTVRPNADGTLTILSPSGKQVGSFAAPLAVTGPGPLTLAGLGSYRGALEFRPAGGGAVQTVEAVRLDDYVRGVISAEVPSSWPSEALKAQAVAARTYAITTDVGGSAYDLYPDTRSQMYRGVAAETPTTDAAVAATRGLVVTYGGVPVVTYFFNSSGGHTENVENVWTGATPEPWLRGVSDPYDSPSFDPYARWGYDLTLDSAAAKLGHLVKGNLIGIRVTKHGTSPRILTAQVVGTGGSTTVTGSTLQHTFGLLTTWASFTTISTFTGRASTAANRPSASGAADSRAVVALVPLVDGMVANAVPAIHGSVFPAPRGATASVQVNDHGRWRSVLKVTLAADGSYDVQLPASGTYRVAYRGLRGPSVSVT